MPEPTTASEIIYLNPQQAGQHLNLNPRTLEKMRSDGGGPKFLKLGKRIRYTKADLDTWARSRACESTFDPAYTTLRR